MKKAKTRRVTSSRCRSEHSAWAALRGCVRATGAALRMPDALVLPAGVCERAGNERKLSASSPAQQRDFVA